MLNYTFKAKKKKSCTFIKLYIFDFQFKKPSDSKIATIRVLPCLSFLSDLPVIKMKSQKNENILKIKKKNT